MTTIPTRNQIARDWNLWAEYVDPSAAMTREEFEAMTIDERVALQETVFGPDERCPSTITLVNPFTGATVEHDITELTEEQVDAYPLDEDVCNELAAEIAPCTPQAFLAAYVNRVGPRAAGIAILGS